MLNNLHKRHLRQSDYTIRWFSVAALVLFAVSAFVFVPLTRNLLAENQTLTQEVASLRDQTTHFTMTLDND